MGTPIEVKSTDKNGVESSVMYDFGDSIEEAIELFGGPACHGAVVAHGKVQLQAVMRRRTLAGQPTDDLASTWKLGVTMTRVVDPIAAAKALFAQKSPEEKLAFLEELKAMA